MRIAIIGAGPAGAMAAVSLARAGASVTVFDPSHPREKPCGGGLTSRALALVADIIDINALAPVVVKTARVEGPADAAMHADVQLADHGISPDSSLLVVSRAVFDRALVDAAVHSGARLIPEKATVVSRRGATLVVRAGEREYSCDQVLGADGANSMVRKRFAAPFTRTQLSVAAGFYVHGASDSSIVIKTTAPQPGYLWSFPRRDHLAIGVCAQAARNVSSSDLRMQSRKWIEQHGLGRAARMTSYAWPIPSVGYEDASQAACSGPGWMLLGDAAGLVDPLTREGIYYALLSGQWAADTVIETVAFREAGHYADRLRSEIHPELARAARLSDLFFHPLFSALFVEALGQSRAIRDVFADLVAGAQPYKGLRRRLLGTREWRLAGRAIRLAVMPSFTGTMRPAVSPQAT
jgi:geranylgeranyl reductase family protein